MKKYVEIAKTYMKTQLIWRWDTFIDVLLAMAKIVFAWILWSILFEGKEQIAGMGFYTMISYYIISSYLYQLDKSSEISQQMTRERKIFCVYGKNSSLIRNRYV